MANSSLFYLRNFFDNATKYSMRRMVSMSRDHHDKLRFFAGNDPNIMNYYQLFLPAYQKFMTIYSNYASVRAQYRSCTIRVENKYVELIQKIKHWDVKIMNVYMDDTPEYASILPNKRNPFQSGSYESRAAEIKMLDLNLNNYPLLNTVQQDVQAFYSDLEQLRTEQQGLEASEVEHSNNLEEARLSLAKKMHGVFGGLLLLYHDDSIQIDKFYERKYFESSQPSQQAIIYTTYQIPANNRLVLFMNELSLNSKFHVQNVSGAPLDYFTSNQADASIPSDVLRLYPNDKEEILATEISDGTPEREIKMLIVYNNSNQNGVFKLAKVELPEDEL